MACVAFAVPLALEVAPLPPSPLPPAGTAALRGAGAGAGAIVGLGVAVLAGVTRRRGKAASTRSSLGRAAVSVGQQVQWKGKAGTVAYVGPVKFASGDWVGVALDGPGGMHDGSVLGVRYFTCDARSGVFTLEADLAQQAQAGPPPEPAAPAAPAPAAPAAEVSELGVGSRVMWQGKPGTVAYIGSVKFAAGEWVGVELDVAQGMHDGTVLGEKYFDGKPR